MFVKLSQKEILKCVMSSQYKVYGLRDNAQAEPLIHMCRWPHNDFLQKGNFNFSSSLNNNSPSPTQYTHTHFFQLHNYDSAEFGSITLSNT